MVQNDDRHNGRGVTLIFARGWTVFGPNANTILLALLLTGMAQSRH